MDKPPGLDDRGLSGLRPPRKQPDALDLLSIVEACYDLEGDDRAWLTRIAKAAGAIIDDGLGIAAMLYGGDTLRDTRITDVTYDRGFPIEQLKCFRARSGQTERTVGTRPVSLESWFDRSCGLVHAIEGLEAFTAALPELGARDLYAINGRDTTGFGVWIGAPLRSVGKVERRVDALWTRVAAHLAAGYRLRRALAANSAPSEAWLTPDGVVVERLSSLETADVSLLRRAVVAIDRARTHEGRADIDQATRAWTGLVRARWTLVDEFNAGGSRYVVARKNDGVASSTAELTQREQMVLGLASLERSNKVIAYELGLSASTVRVLFARAAAKLGVKHRDDAIARYRALNGTPRDD